MRVLEPEMVIEEQKRAGAFRPEISLRRAPLRAAEIELIDRPSAVPLLAVGVAGSGKTTWLCQIAQERRQANQAVVYLDDALDTGGSFNEGELAEALEVLAERSSDGRILAIADDAGGRPFRDSLLHRLLELARAVSNRPTVRMLLALRSDIFGGFLDRHPTLLSRDLFRELALRPLDRYELTTIARRLPSPDGQDPDVVRVAREQTALHLVRSADPSCLIPALAVSFLETIEVPSFLGNLSRYKLYSHLYYGRVLRSAADRTSVSKSRLLKSLASTLAAGSDDTLIIDATPSASLPIDPDGVSHELLSARLIERRVDDYGVHVGFVDDDFLAFVAAVAIDGQISDRLRECLAKGERFPRARRVAAFFVARVLSGSAGTAEQIFATLPGDDIGFLQLVGEFDRDAFLALLPLFAQDNSSEAIHLVEEFESAGFAHLAVDGARLLLDCAPTSERTRVRRLYGKALCKVDRLAEAQLVLEESERSGESDPELLYLLGEIAIARRQLADAERWYSRILGAPDVTLQARAKALHGLGDLQAWHGRYRASARTIRGAIRLYTNCGDSADLAEAWGDLSLVLVDLKKCKEARAAVAQSRSINLRLSMSFPGLIIVNGLDGNVDLCEGNLNAAEKRLSKCLEDCQNYGLRWREGWCLQRLAEVAERGGDSKKAVALRAHAEEILTEL